ncbi:anthranilate phosphoribosyltransferase [Colletotrichum musicola]|uniref:Anthranilate phosphoribosyltransferase n=1 Tax=Colletotrichum musicola TaxID=2175873 RepID=A0A8H6K2P5_9PEZI|nr:anthranilate phosphoribosyltransferase [Colletotrichum musicola]
MASQSQPPPVAGSDASLPLIDIKPLLKKLWPVPDAGLTVTPDEIADAISHFFTHQVSDAQAASLLIALHFTNLDRRADVMARSAHVMRLAAAKVDFDSLSRVVAAKNLGAGEYRGGLCDIVGTGGDSHNTFNISTTASILASSLLLVAKHGNRASTSKSGSADLVNNMKPRPPVLMAVSPDTIDQVYSATNYGFLFAPVFHPGMRYVAPIRKELPWRTIFNLLGPLANPVEDILEARVIGVARKELGPVFLEALKIGGSKKAMIICGEEELDEVSCAGPTLVWRLREASPGGEIVTDHFRVQPSDFGLGTHPLNTVSPGKEPAENAEILRRILGGEMADDDPILEFVLMNAATLFVASGLCEAESSSMGPGDDGKVITERGPGGGRWKEGVRRARWAIKSGEAWKQWKAFVDVTNGFGQ